jgi:hypothetical protein
MRPASQAALQPPTPAALAANHSSAAPHHAQPISRSTATNGTNGTNGSSHGLTASCTANTAPPLLPPSGNNAVEMQTTATYLPETQEFEVHTPTTLAQKYWITNSAVHAQWAVVFAQLMVRGQNQGIHGLLVRIRGPDMKPCKVGRAVAQWGWQLCGRRAACTCATQPSAATWRDALTRRMLPAVLPAVLR